MSGPKCGQAQLNREREEALRRQREVEERRRRQEETTRREKERQRAIAAARGDASQALSRTNAAREQADRADASRWAAAELKAAVDQQNRARQGFDSATSVPEFGQASTLAIQAEQAFLKVCQSSLTRAEDDRLRREMERKKAEASGAVAKANRLAEFVGHLPHQKFAPGELDQAKKGIGEATRTLNAGEYDRATAAGERAAQVLSALEVTVRSRHQIWLEQKQAAENALAKAWELVQGLDGEFLTKWARGTHTAIQAESERLATLIKREEFGAVMEGAAKLAQQVAQAVAEADETYAQEGRRVAIVDSMYRVLYGMGFTVGVNLADPSDPTGPVIISAGDSSGRNVEINVNLAADQIHLDLDDDDVTGTRKGANCVESAEDLIALLADEGVEFEMTDWGKADPDRVKKAAKKKELGAKTQQEKDR